VPEAVSSGNGLQGLEPLGLAGQVAQIAMGPPAIKADGAPTSVALFEQGLVQVLEASVTGLDPKQPYVLALSEHADGTGALQPLAAFTANPAGAAIVNAIGPIRQVVHGDVGPSRRYLVIASGSAAQPGKVLQIQRN
jgi:hypothetical protein